MALIRTGVAQDLPEIAAIQAASPEAAQWDPASYLAYDLRVCIGEGRVAGFAVARATAPDECELLNLAVAPAFRRCGVGRSLMESLLQPAPIASHQPRAMFLEVRESNSAARAFYKKLGFQEVHLRQNYYTRTGESAIVMKFHSC